MQNLFVCKVNYTKPIEQVEAVRAEHRAYLKLGYDAGKLLVSGPRNPKDGGLIVGRFANMNEVLEFAKNDPFCLHGVAEYEVIEFEAVLYADCLRDFVQQ